MGFGTWIKNLFQPLIRALWKMVKEVISGSTELILAQLKDLALDAVQMVASDASIITSEDKRKKAFEIIKKNAIGKGLTIQSHLINVAIELALAYLKRLGRL